MAMSYLEELKKRQQEQAPAAQPQQETGLRGVSTNTQQQLNNYNQGYKPSEAVQTAQQNMQTVQQQKPQSFTSKYGAQLDNILAQIQTPKEFKYEFNNDGLFRSYADLFTQQAKQASQNAMGQAAALTGGYGNSYAQAAGNQAYQQAILPLYDRGMELAQMARANYDKDRGDLYNQLGALQGMDESEYGRYQDALNQWRQDEQNAMDMYRDERDFGYQDYANMLDYWNNQARAENADYRADQDEDFRRESMIQDQQQFETTTKMEYDQLAEKVREFDASMSEDQRQYNQKMAASWVSDILANGQIPSMDLLAMAGLSYEDAQKLVAQLQAGGTGGPDKKQSTGFKEALNNTGNVLNQIANEAIYGGVKGASMAAALNTANIYDLGKVSAVDKQISKSAPEKDVRDEAARQAEVFAKLAANEKKVDKQAEEYVKRLKNGK